MINDNLLRFQLDKTKLIVLDTETESLNLHEARPWEVAWDVYEGKKLVESYQFYLDWPNLNVGRGAAAITGFNPENIKKYGQDPKEIIDKLNRFLYNPEYKVIGANLLGFDIYILNTARRELGYKTDYSYLNRLYDTVALSKAYNLGLAIPENPNDFLAFQYKMCNHVQKGLKSSNSYMAELLGAIVDKTRLHQAAYDNGLCYHVFSQLIYKLDIV